MTGVDRVGRLAEAVGRFSLRHPVPVLVGAVLLAGVCGSVASRLEFRSDYIDLLPPDSREVQDLRHVSTQAGSPWFTILAVDRHSSILGESASLEPTLEWSAELAEKLEASPLVRYCELRLPLAFLEERRLLFLTATEIRDLTNEVEERIASAKYEASPFYLDLDGPEESAGRHESELLSLPEDLESYSGLSEYHLDQNGRYVYLLIKPTTPATDIAASQRLFDALDAVIATHVETTGTQFATRYGGAHYVHLAEANGIDADLQRASLWALLLSCLFVLAFTRRARTLVIVFVPLVVGLALTFCFTQLLIARLNILSGFLVGILIGIGLDFAVHLLLRHRQHLSRGASVEEAIVHACRETAAPSTTAAVTTAAAFFSLTLSDFPAFSEFGLIAGIGVLCALLTTFVIAPPLVVLIHRRWPEVVLGAHGSAPPSAAEPATVEAGEGSRPRRGLSAAFFFGTIVLALLGGFSLPHVEFEIDLDAIRGPNEAFAFDHYVEESLGLATSPEVIVVRNLEEAERVETIIREVADSRGAHSGIGEVVSLASLIPENQAERLEAIAELRDALHDPALEHLKGEEQEVLAQARRWSDVRAFGPAELPDDLARRFRSDDGEESFVLIFGEYDESSIRDALRWTETIGEIRERALAEGIAIRVVSGTLVSGRLFSLAIEEGPFVLWATFLAVFGVLLLHLRSLRASLLVLMPVGLGLLILIGLSVLLDVRLNFINVMLFPVLVGIAVDDTLHMLHRYRTLGPGSVRRVLREIGAAAVLASGTTAVGFGALMSAQHHGLASMGLLAVLGIGVVLYTSVIFFAATLRLIEAARRGRART